MRISDWSSDVCSSDLRDLRREFAQDIEFEGRTRRELPVGVRGSERADRSAGEFGNEKASLTRKSLNLYRDLVEAVIGYRDAGHTQSRHALVGRYADIEQDRRDATFET